MDLPFVQCFAVYKQLPTAKCRLALVALLNDRPIIYVDTAVVVAFPALTSEQR